MFHNRIRRYFEPRDGRLKAATRVRLLRCTGVRAADGNDARPVQGASQESSGRNSRSLPVLAPSLEVASVLGPPVSGWCNFSI
jgi:hypothetical protein